MWVRKKDLNKDQITKICNKYYVDKCKGCPLNLPKTNLCIADFNGLNSEDFDKIKAKAFQYITPTNYMD